MIKVPNRPNRQQAVISRDHLFIGGGGGCRRGALKYNVVSRCDQENTLKGLFFKRSRGVHAGALRGAKYFQQKGYFFQNP